jgi:hypothetical protein
VLRVLPVRRQYTKVVSPPHLSSNTHSHRLRLLSADGARGAGREPTGACAAAQSCPSVAGRAARAGAAAARLTALATAALAELPSSRRLAGTAAAVRSDARRQARCYKLYHVTGHRHSHVRAFVRGNIRGLNHAHARLLGQRGLHASVLQCEWAAPAVAFSAQSCEKLTQASSPQHPMCRPGMQPQSAICVEASEPSALQAEAHDLVERERYATAAVKQLHASLLSERAAHIPVVRALQHARRATS